MRSLNKKSKGVAVIFLALTFGLMFGFLLLVVNTGFLIYQKIKLQSAVDLAAYAGAAVQAAYLNDDGSGDNSVQGMNKIILDRYSRLYHDMNYFGTVTPWPQGFMDPGSCAAACVAANLANGDHAVRLYKEAADDMAAVRDRLNRLLLALPEAARQAAEETVKLNIPELAVDSSGGVGAFFSGTTNKVDEIVQQTNNQSEQANVKSAVLSFSSEKGLYLANVVASVPHTFAYFGPACLPRNPAATFPYYYCTVNGAGGTGGEGGFQMAALAMAKVFSGPQMSGNVGNISKISATDANAIRLNFILNPHKPGPMFVAAAEWYPENGSMMNLENSLGATGSLFPTKSRLVAVAAAEPFGAAMLAPAERFGVRLQGIRKLLLDPRFQEVQDDFPGLMDYMKSLAPMDETGGQKESANDVIRRFLH